MGGGEGVTQLGEHVRERGGGEDDDLAGDRPAVDVGRPPPPAPAPCEDHERRGGDVRDLALDVVVIIVLALDQREEFVATQASATSCTTT